MAKWWGNLLRDPGKGMKPDMLKGPDGFWYRILHDDEGTEKLEDEHPANTWIELLAWVVAIFTVLNFLLSLLANLSQIFGWVLVR